MIDYIENLCEVLKFDEDTVFGNQTPLYFDACLKEIIPTLKYGATTHLIPRKLFLLPVKLVEYLNEKKINTLCWVVSALTYISAFKTFDTVIPQHIKTISFASEVFPVRQLNLWRAALPNTRFINLYGPTETTGICCYYEVDREFKEDEVLPVGRPFPNTEVILLDENNCISAPGEQGEICIRGTRLTHVTFKGTGEKTILDVGDYVYLPQEVIASPMTQVKIGFTGVSKDGPPVIPTLWAELGTTRPAAPTDLSDGVEDEGPVAPTWAQFQAQLKTVQEEVEVSGSELHKDPISGKLFLMRGEKKLGEGVDVGTNSLSFDSGYVDKEGYLHLTQGGVDVEGFAPIYVGLGGGNGGMNFNVTLTNLNESRIITVPEGQRVVLRFNYSSVDDVGIDDGNGMGQLIIGGIVRKAFNALQGVNELDITEFLSSGTNSVSLRVTNSEETDKSLAYTVTVAAVYLASPFDASVPYLDAFSFPYTPTGIAEKTVYFELDGTVVGTQTITTSGRQQSFQIPKQSHGSHVLRCWFTCNIDGTTVSSNVLYYSIICVAVPDVRPIIAVTSPPTTGVEQFTNIVKKYRVYDPASLTAAITLEVDGEVVADLTVDRTEHTWTYRADNVGQITQTVRCGEVSVSWTQTVTESSIKVEAEVEALALHLSSYGRSNAENDPGIWENNGYKAEFQGFNFVSDGWVNDEDDNTVLRVSGDARLHIPYKMFADDFRTTGKTLEFELATREVIDYDTEVLTCWNGGRGFRITARQFVLASEQSQLGTRYKENEHIRVTFVAQKRSEYRLLLCYINGIMSGAVQYPEDDDFSQATPVGITVGSNECTVDLYSIRAYDNSLTRYQVLDNWIADTRDALVRMERFKRNDVYDEYGQVVIEKLPQSLCYLVIECPQLPQFKGDKKKCSGYFVDRVHPDRNFSFTDAEIDVQGTSSQYYWRKNYKNKFKDGFILYDGSTVSVYAMNENAVPVNTFTFKADVASSEGAYNTVSAKLYNDLCPYKMPAQAEDPRYRYSIDGFPIVMFWEGPNGLEFLGKYNFNNDKGVPESFGLKEGDERWEVLENGNDLVGFHSADFTANDWTKSFEGNFPDKNTDTTKLQAMCAWVNSTKGNPEKFTAELDQWFVPELVDWYYLFTELLLCMDQREKNVLWRYVAALQRWWPDYYDADSIIGFNNQAQPVFDYYLEDIDYTASGDPVYNGQNSVFWQNVRSTRHEHIKAMYQQKRNDGSLSYEVVWNAIEQHQSNWPEAIFNEDMQAKCLDALEQNGDATYLPFLWGKKELWTKQWLSDRFRYLDSKYEAGDSMTKRMTIRTNKMADITLTSYVNMYGHVYYNAEHIAIRMERNTPYTFESQASGVEDRVIGINDADKLTSLGDLAPHDVELIDLSPCEMLTEIKLGDGAEDYENYSLTTVTFGENKLLRKVDIRNCVAYAQAPDLSGCANIEEVYAEGTAITGIKLPNGGVLKTMHLPETVVSLQVVNQPKLEDFSIPAYGQITTLRLENAGALDAMAFEILNSLPANSRVRIVGFDMEMTNSELAAFITKLDTMRGLDENGNNTELAQVSGRIYLEEVNGTTLVKAEKYVGLTVEYGSVYLNSTRLVERTLSGDYTNDRVTSVGGHAFYGLGLENVDLPKATTLGGSAFYRNEHPISLNIPKVARIGGRCFIHPGFKYLCLPSIETLSGEIFYVSTGAMQVLDLPIIKGFGEFYSLARNEWKCPALVLRSTSIATLGIGFSGGVLKTGTGYVYVPRALLSDDDATKDYRRSTNWSAVATQFRALEDYTVDGTITGELDYEKMGVTLE